MTATVSTASITPQAFMAHLRRLMKARRAVDVVAFFEQHSHAVLDRPSESQRSHLDDIMHWADTATEFEPRHDIEQPVEAHPGRSEAVATA